MEWKDTLNTLMSVFAGAAITGFGALWKSRKDRQAVVGRTLTELMEVRHLLVSTEGLLNSIQKLTEVQFDHLTELRDGLEGLVPKDEGLSERYGLALTDLAAFEPILAFNLRAKNRIPHWLADLRTRALKEGTSVKHFEMMEREIRRLAVPALDEAILELARRHGFLTWFRVRREVLPTKSREAMAEEVMRRLAKEAGLPQA